MDHRLARLLDTPFFARVVPHLAPETLRQLIQYRGLDACGELVAAATPAQLTSLLDLDLWHRAQPGRDDQFDVDRFGEWLEVLVNIGDSVAARTVAALDEHLVIVALSRYLRLFDPGTFEPTESSDDEPMDRDQMMNSETSGDVLECEVGGYLVRARRTDAWDAIVTLLVTLETEHNRHFHAVMQGCRRLSNARPEIDGLDDLQMAPEQLLHDVAIERERRRSQNGYATRPTRGPSFKWRGSRNTRHRRQVPRSPSTPSPPPTFGRPTRNRTPHQKTRLPDVRECATPRRDRPLGARRRRYPHVHRRGHRTAGRGWRDAETAASPARGRARGPSSNETPAPEAADGVRAAPRRDRVPHAQSRACVPRQYAARGILRSVAVLHASGSVRCGCLHLQPGSRMLALAVARCDLPGCIVGTRTRHSHASQRVPRESRPRDGVRSGLVSAVPGRQPVRGGSARLDVGRSSWCRQRHSPRPPALQRKLETARDAGTPWLARDAADVLAMLDMTAWISVLGLLDECPILPAALTAVLERHTTFVSSTAFEFISTTAQVGDIRLFMRTLPGVLSR